jgi:hypothetical protein
MATPVLSLAQPVVLEPAAPACADATALSPAVPRRDHPGGRVEPRPHVAGILVTGLADGLGQMAAQHLLASTRERHDA